MAQTWLFASGKGGVGKSTLCAALGVALAKAGHSVAIMDAVCGLRNQDLLLNMADRIVYDLGDVIEKNCDIDQALTEHGEYHNLKLLSAPQFISMNRLNPKDMRKLIGALRVRFDFVLVDCPSGIEKGLINVVESADRVLLVLTPDDVSMRDGERAAQIIEQQKGPRPELIVNRLMPHLVENGVMYTPETVSMVLDLELMGIIPDDVSVYRSVLTHEDWMQNRGDAALAVERIAKRMAGETVSLPAYAPSGNKSFFDRFKRKRGDTLL